MKKERGETMLQRTVDPTYTFNSDLMIFVSLLKRTDLRRSARYKLRLMEFDTHVADENCALFNLAQVTLQSL